MTPSRGGERGAVPELVAAVLAATREPLVVLDDAGRVISASRGFLATFRLFQEELDGYELLELSGGAWATPELAEAVRTALAGAAPPAVEARIPVRSSAALPVRVALTPVPAAGDAGGWIVVTARPIEDADAPASEAELFRLLSENSSDIVALHEADGRFRLVSQSSRSMIGVGPEELTGTDPLERVHADDLERARGFFGALVREGRPARAAFRVQTRSGDALWMEVVGRSVTGAGGGPVIQTAWRDITQRKRAEEALEWLSGQTRLILNSAAEGILGLDAAGRVTFINAAASEMLGYAPRELIGEPFHERVHHTRADGDSLPEEEAPITSVIREGVVHTISDEVFWRKDGSCFPVEYTGTPTLEGGRRAGAVVTFRDIADRLRSEEAVRRSEWLAGIGETALGLRHEINNPLTSMLADASLLEMGGNTTEEEREMIESIIKQARRIRDVVRRLAERKHDPSVRIVGSQRMIDLSGPPAEEE